MKFGRRLLFSQVTEWNDYYLDYKALKKVIKGYAASCQAALDADLSSPETGYPVSISPVAEIPTIEVELAPAAPELPAPELPEAAPAPITVSEAAVAAVAAAADDLELRAARQGVATTVRAAPDSALRAAQARALADFTTRLENELSRIEAFYETQCRRIPERLEEIRQRMVPLTAQRAEFADIPATSSRFKPAKYRLRSMEAALKKEFMHAGVRLADLAEFVALNQTGFMKITKKFDRDTLLADSARSLCPSWCTSHVADQQFAHDSQQLLADARTELYSLYETVFKGESDDLAESVVKTRSWKANPIMCDFDSHAARAQIALPLGAVPTLAELYAAPKAMWRATRADESDSENEDNDQPDQGGRQRSHSSMVKGFDHTNDDGMQQQKSAKAKAKANRPRMPRFRPWVYVVFGLCVALVAVFAAAPILAPEHRPAQRCLGILLAAAILWATEAVPLFVTALIIPILVTTLSVLTNTDGTIMTAPDAASYVLKHMMSSTILLVLTGFSIATAMKKYQLDQMVALRVLRLAKGRPRVFLLLMMLMGAILSTFVSNVAAPVIILSLVLPIVRTLPKKSSFTLSLLLGNAMATNIGGMMSPISSPQNSIGVQVLADNGYSISFLWFLAISLPVVLVLTLIIYAIITYGMFKPDVDVLPPLEGEFGRLRREHYVVMVISVVAIALWCAVTGLKSSIGDIGIISLIPLAAFFFTGVLSKEDFENGLPWAVVFLVMGGSILGKAVELSKLLELVANLFSGVAAHGEFVLCLIMALFLAVVASVVSHTVSALIVLPLVAAIAAPINAVFPCVIVAMLMCSGAAGLPVSSFPNVSTTSVVDEKGEAYVSASLIGKVGWLATFINLIGSVTIGYGMAKVVPAK